MQTLKVPGLILALALLTLTSSIQAQPRALLSDEKGPYGDLARAVAKGDPNLPETRQLLAAHPEFRAALCEELPPGQAPALDHLLGTALTLQGVQLEGVAGPPYGETIRVLVEAGANVNGTYTGSSLFSLACETYKPDLVSYFLDHKADPNKQASPYSEVPLRRVIWGRDEGLILPIVMLLVEHGADINGGGSGSSTPLSDAESRHYGRVVDYLKEHGAR